MKKIQVFYFFFFRPETNKYWYQISRTIQMTIQSIPTSQHNKTMILSFIFMAERNTPSDINRTLDLSQPLVIIFFFFLKYLLTQVFRFHPMHFTISDRFLFCPLILFEFKLPDFFRREIWHHQPPQIAHTRNNLYESTKTILFYLDEDFYVSLYANAPGKILIHLFSSQLWVNSRKTGFFSLGEVVSLR